MTPIPVVATNYNDPSQVKFFSSVREAARTFGNEETIRKSLAKECNSDPNSGITINTSNNDSWFIEYFYSFVSR